MMDRKILLEKKKEAEEYKKECEENLTWLYTDFGSKFFRQEREIPQDLQSEAADIKKTMEALAIVSEEQQKLQEELDKPPVYICPNCHLESVPGAKFCHECGTKLIPDIQENSEEQEETLQMERERICPNCGNPLKSKRKFCGKCGTPVL